MSVDPPAIIIALLYVIMVGLTFYMVRKGKW